MFTNAKKCLTALGILALGLSTLPAAAGDWTRALDGNNDTTVAVIDALNKSYPVRHSGGNGSYSYMQRGDNDMTTDVLDSINRSGQVSYPAGTGVITYSDRGDNDMTVAVIDAINRDSRSPSAVHYQAPGYQYPVAPSAVVTGQNDDFAQINLIEYNG